MRQLLCIVVVPFLLASLPPSVYAAEITPADNVTVRVELDKPEVEIGQPVLVRLIYENHGQETYYVEIDHAGFFHQPCTVTDDAGKALPNPFAQAGLSSRSASIPTVTHPLPPGKTVTDTRLLNECVIFSKPGTYRVEPASKILPLNHSPEPPFYRQVKTASAALRVKAADPARRAANVDALLRAWQTKAPLPEGLIPKEYVQSWADQSAERVLATMGEERLIPVFLDALEGQDWNAVAAYGLMGVPDRAKVLQAYEDRLAHPEIHNVINLLNYYAELKTDTTKGLDAFFQQFLKERDTYRARYLAFLRADTTYRFGILAHELWAWKTDPFLLSYLLRTKPADQTLLDCARQMQGITLPKDDEPFLTPLLDSKEQTLRDLAMTQLLTINPERYAPTVRADRDQKTGRFSQSVWDKVK
jgi:hypothetical protein